MIFPWKKFVTILFILSVHKVRTSDYPEKNEIKQLENEESTEGTVNYRLPTDVVPTEYFVRLTPHIAPNNFTFNGTVKIIGKVKNSTSKIVLHGHQIQVAGANVFKTNADGSMKTLKVLDVTTKKKQQFLIIRLLDTVSDGTILNIEIYYNGKINTEMYGLFRNWYKAEDGSIRWIFATQLQPSGARRVFPCFDEPALKAVFHVSIDVPENCTALGNMPIKSVKDGSLVTFEDTPPMSTYLVAVAFGDFAGVSGRAKNVSYTVWSSRPVSSQLSFALSVAPAAIDYMESRLKVPYGLGKLELLAVPDFPSEAMENWGLIVLSEILTLYDPARTSISFRKGVRNLITHEIAHQWFGNLVTARWWDCLWLHEAFAAYFEYHAHDDNFDSWNLESDFVVDYLHVGLEFDSYNDSHPLTDAVYSSSEVESMFDPISYNKGASLVRMLEKILGSKVFFGALGRYLEKNKFSIANPEYLYSAVEQEIKSNEYSLNMSIAKMMDSWTLQTGYPVIDAQFNEESVTLKQSRFFLRSEQKWNDDILWVVPLNWATQSEPNFNVTNKLTWLTEKSTVVHLGDIQNDWVIFNIQQTGFYRVNYDKKMWQRITEVLKSDEFEVIHEVNRASLINDLFSLGRSGLLDYDIVLAASQYLTQETNYFPWKAAFSGLTFLKKRFAGHSEVMNYFKNYIASLVKINYGRLGFYEKESDSDLDKLLRELTLKLLCYIEHEDCVRTSLDIFIRMQNNDKYFAVSPNLQAVVFCTAIKHGSSEYWNVLAEKFEKSNHAAEIVTILYGFSCSRNTSQIQSLLQKIITYESGVRKQDAKVLLSYIAENSPVGVQSLLNFIQNYSGKIIDYFSGDDIIPEICGIIIDVLSTEELVLKFKEFVNSGEKSSADESFIEAAENELKWYTTYTPKILEWLKANYSSNSFKPFSNN